MGSLIAKSAGDSTAPAGELILAGGSPVQRVFHLPAVVLFLGGGLFFLSLVYLIVRVLLDHHPASRLRVPEAAVDVAAASVVVFFVGGSLWLYFQTRNALRIMEQFAKTLAQGDYTRRVDVAAAGPLGALAATLNRMTTEIQLRIADLEVERNGLRAVLNSMEEGVLVVDSEKRILMANLAAHKMVHVPEGGLAGRPLSEVLKQPDLIENIGLSISAGQTCSFEFQNEPNGALKQHVLARCAPFRDESRLQRGAVAVFHDITEIRRLEKVRTEFVANVSHELRTPLTSLLGYLETLQEGMYSDPAEAKHFLTVCHRQADRLSHIVDDLLRLSRLENPQQEIAASEVDLQEVVFMAVDQCKNLAKERGIRLEQDLPGRNAVIWGDRGLLVQAVANLVENAINYNREKGTVIVRLSAPQGNANPSIRNWEIAVSDTGIGVPQDSIHRIFERFYRVDKARSRERGGTGLGLAIVKHIALAHGGSVHVESEIDKGSVFFLRFRARVTEKSAGA